MTAKKAAAEISTAAENEGSFWGEDTKVHGLPVA